MFPKRSRIEQITDEFYAVKLSDGEAAAVKCLAVALDREERDHESTSQRDELDLIVPIFPEHHPALCYEQHDPNDCIEPHVHVGGTAWIVQVPDSEGRIEQKPYAAVVSVPHDQA